MISIRKSSCRIISQCPSRHSKLSPKGSPSAASKCTCPVLVCCSHFTGRQQNCSQEIVSSNKKQELTFIFLPLHFVGTLVMKARPGKAVAEPLSQCCSDVYHRGLKIFYKEMCPQAHVPEFKDVPSLLPLLCCLCIPSH